MLVRMSPSRARALALSVVILLTASRHGAWRFTAETACTPTLSYKIRMQVRKILSFEPTKANIVAIAGFLDDRREELHAEYQAGGKLRHESRTFLASDLAPEDVSRGRDVEVDLISTVNTTSRDVIMIFDGGAYCMHDGFHEHLTVPLIYLPLIRRVGYLNAPILAGPLYSLCYTHAPTVEYTEKEAYTAYLGLQRAGYRIVALGGQSGGGTIALTLIASLIAREKRQPMTTQMPPRLLLFSPVASNDLPAFDAPDFRARMEQEHTPRSWILTGTNNFCGPQFGPGWKAEDRDGYYLGEDDPASVKSVPSTDPRCSPLYLSHWDFFTFPETLVTYGTAEAQRNIIIELLAKMRMAGVPVVELASCGETHPLLLNQYFTRIASHNVPPRSSSTRSRAMCRWKRPLATCIHDRVTLRNCYCSAVLLSQRA